MPNIASLHPQLVHFAIALLVVGVIARMLSSLPWAFAPRWTWLSPMATALVLIGTIGAVLSVESGIDAHGPVERIPGARDAVVEHEDWGIRTRNFFLVVAALELAVLLVRGRWASLRPRLMVASALMGMAGLYVLYETAEHGGELVYSYAGGVGTRSGDTTDVGRLLLAGLYQQAMLDRREKRPERAAELIAQMARRWPDDLTIKFLAAESQLLDKQDARGALAAVSAIQIAPEDTRSRMRRDFLRADAYVAGLQRDSARAVLEALARDFPDNTRVKDRLDRLNRP